MIEMRFQIVFTYRCNLECKWCDRFMDSNPWLDSDITMEDLYFGIQMIRRSNVKVTMSRIGGGEAMVHPDFVALTKFVRKEWSRDGEVKTSVATNMVKGCEKGLDVLYKKSPPNDKNHMPVMISPADLGIDPVHGYVDSCRVARVCGRGFDAFGFSPCPYAGPIGRVIGVDPYQSRPVLLGAPEICQHCVHSLSTKDKNKMWEVAKAGYIQFPTKTYREGMERGPTEFRRFQERIV